MALNWQTGLGGHDLNGRPGPRSNRNFYRCDFFFEVENELEINTQSMLQTAEEMIQNQPTRSSKSCLRFRARQSSFLILE